MPAPNAISPDKLARLIGTARAPVILDVRSAEDFAADPRLLPGAVPSEVEGVAERHNAAPFDIEGVFFSHRGELCSFDVMLLEFGLSIPALDRLATIVRGADTARLELTPEAAGLLAASLGLSRMYADDLEQLEAGMGLYDAFYRWARDATGETHNWPSAKAGVAL